MESMDVDEREREREREREKIPKRRQKETIWSIISFAVPFFAG